MMSEETKILFSIGTGIFLCGIIGAITAYHWPPDVRPEAAFGATFAILGFSLMAGILTYYFLEKSEK